MKNFSIDNPFFDFMNRTGDIILLNLLFVFTSIPIITAGTAMTALDRVILRIIRGESNYPAREYFRAFKEEWKKSGKMWMFFLLTGILFIFDFLYAGNLPMAYSVAVGCVFIIWYAVFTYAFWLQARFENTIRNTLKNALYLAIRHLPYTLAMMCLNALPVICILMGETATSMIVPLYLVFGFGLAARLDGTLIDKYLQK